MVDVPLGVRVEARERLGAVADREDSGPEDARLGVDNVLEGLERGPLAGLRLPLKQWTSTAAFPLIPSESRPDGRGLGTGRVAACPFLRSAHEQALAAVSARAAASSYASAASSYSASACVAAA